MAGHFHGILDKISQHILPKRMKEGISSSSQSSSEDRGAEVKSSEPPLTKPPPPPSDFRPNDKYTEIKDLDAGEEAQCSVVKSRSTGRVYVRKHTRAPSPPPQRRRPANLSPPRPPTTGRRKPLPPEARMLMHLQPYHENIIRYFGVETSPHGPERYNIYLEFCSGGDLLDQLRSFRNASTRSGPTAPVVFTLHVIASLAHALAYLHHGLRWKAGRSYQDPKEGKAWDAVIHGDIKPDNIFLRHHPHAQVKGLPDVVLGDFGMSQFLSQSSGITGTPGYDSPEVRAVANLQETNPTLYERQRSAPIMTPKSDVYQLGLIMYLMATGRHFKIGADPAGIELDSTVECRDVTGFVALMVWCLQPDAKQRPECTSELVEGCLFAVDVLMRRRDGMVATEVGKLAGAWNRIDLAEKR